MRVLIAEDEPVSRLRLSSQLRKWGYDVSATCDGDEAWAALGTEDPPRLAILDWEMPGLDGTEIRRRLRARGSEPYVYVLLLTARDSRGDIVFGLSAGADDYLAKPFDTQELEVRLRVGRRIVDLQAELVSAREALRFQATHDALTGLSNRAALMQALWLESTRSQREGTPLAVVMLDLDHLKRVNDTYGHPAGDAVLRECARRASMVVRPYDVLARYGGEEFVALLPSCDMEMASGAAERIRATLSAGPVQFGTQPIPVTCSVGVALLRPGELPEVLMARADAALYRAKSSGRDRVEIEREAA